jgi:hypothetical protein
MKLYENVKKSVAYQTDKSCCSVITHAVLNSISFEEAQKDLAAVGRKPNKGAYSYQSVKAMQNAGWVVCTAIRDLHFRNSNTASIKDFFINRYPPSAQGHRTVTPKHNKGFAKTEGWKQLKELSMSDDFAIYFSFDSHVAAYKHGEFQDWCANRSLRTETIFIFKRPGVPTPQFLRDFMK